MADQSFETRLAQRLQQRIERIAASPHPGFVDKRLSEAIVAEELRTLVRLASRTIAQRIAEKLSLIGTTSAQDVEAITALEIEKFLHRLDAGEFDDSHFGS